MKLTKSLLAIGLMLSAISAQATNPPCPAGTINCSNQHMGDTTTTADNTQSHATQIGNSTNSNQSGNSIDAENNLQQSGNTVDQSGNRLGDSNSSATGNRLDSNNDNRSSVGNTSSNSGGNQMNGLGGAANATTGPVTSTSAGGSVTGSGNSTANGGAGGQGGQGGTGGTGTALSGSLSGASNGDQTTTVANGSTSLSGASATSGDSLSGAAASTGDQSLTGSQDQALTNTTAASADGSGNSEVGVRVDASDRSSNSYSAQALYLPSNPTNIPVGIAGSNVTVYYGACGPLKAIETNAVTGTYFGLVRKHKVHLGHTDRIVPYQGAEYIERSYPDGSSRLFGHQAVRTVAVVSVAGGRSISLGGGQTGGGWGQAGAGGSSAMQQVVNQIDLELCEAYRSAPEPHLPLIEFQKARIPRG